MNSKFWKKKSMRYYLEFNLIYKIYIVMNTELELLKKELNLAKQENLILKDKLKTYTNPDRYKKYYEKNKQEILKNKKDARSKIDIMETFNILSLSNIKNNPILKRYLLFIQCQTKNKQLTKISPI
jgi:hypothetical protein